MSSKASSTAALILLLIIIIIFFTCVSFHSHADVANPCPPKNQAKCPRDTLKFGVCGSWLGLVHEVVGTAPSEPCCTLIRGLADLEAAVCLCTAIKANVLGALKLEAPVALSLVVNACGKKVPQGFVCS